MSINIYRVVTHTTHYPPPGAQSVRTWTTADGEVSICQEHEGAPELLEVSRGLHIGPCRVCLL
jgi:hypothetical protein